MLHIFNQLRGQAEQPGIASASGSETPSTGQIETANSQSVAANLGDTNLAPGLQVESQYGARSLANGSQKITRRTAILATALGQWPIGGSRHQSWLVQPLAIGQNDTSESSMRKAMLLCQDIAVHHACLGFDRCFYPAIDLCAGEKERGTLETLLSSPARRREIVWGKLFTVATFSVMSAC